MTRRSLPARNRFAAAALACGLCVGAVAPYALAATPPALPVSAATPWEGGAAADRDGLLGQVLTEAAGAAIVIVTPGTDDTGLHPRIDGVLGGRNAAYVQYPESFGPVIGGKADTPLGLPFFAPTYVKSRQIAEQRNLDIMEELVGYNGPVVYTGYSQGAEAVGNAAEEAHEKGFLGENTLILLISDPRSPWGIKAFAKDLPLSDVLVTPALGLIGIDNNGARDPGKTGDDTQVVAVIVKGDPVADWQWKWYRPGSSLLVNLAGFLAIHSPGDGPYGQLDGKTSKRGGGDIALVVNRDADGNIVATGPDGPQPTMLSSDDGKTAYAIYDTYHPLALLNALILDAVGIKYDEDDLKRWDKHARTFYPMEDPGTDNARGGVKINEGNGGLQPTGTRSSGAASDADAALDISSLSRPGVVVHEESRGTLSELRSDRDIRLLPRKDDTASVDEDAVEQDFVTDAGKSDDEVPVEAPTGTVGPTESSGQSTGSTLGTAVSQSDGELAAVS